MDHQTYTFHKIMFQICLKAYELQILLIILPVHLKIFHCIFYKFAVKKTNILKLMNKLKKNNTAQPILHQGLQ